ncbi:MAG: succinate dehydrogenase, cytochrome b556 subunit [Rickettsiaceae bacterium]|nr:succinate dehydrogenase, cytochrome b556 subunit [Rickettsiaceae bacterium]
MATKQELHSKRPLSPHLSIYKPQITSILSIFHRLTGVGLYIAVMSLSWLFIWHVFFPKCEIVKYIINLTIFSLCIKLASLALFYHFFNGIRHLFWDTGLGFKIETVYASGYSVIFLTLAYTIILWTVLI